jgi:hypothetical protein
LIHVALEGSTPQVRRSANDIVESHVRTSPLLVSKVINDAIKAFILRGPPQSVTSVPTAAGDDEAPVNVWNKHSRLVALLMGSVSFGSGTDPEEAETGTENGKGKKKEVEREVREEAVIELVIPAHHSLICKVLGITFLTSADIRFLCRRTIKADVD